MESLNNKQFGLFIERLRILRNIKVNDFIYDICSHRQYYRYTNGGCSIPNDKLVKMSDKLSISITELFVRFNESKMNQRDLLHKQLRNLNNYDNKNVLNFVNSTNVDEYYTDYNRDLFTLIKLIIEYRMDLITKTHVEKSITKLIDYPECMKHDILNTIELNGLITLYSLNKKKEIYLSMYENLMSSESLLQNYWKDNSVIMSNITQHLGSLGEYDKVLDVVNKSLNYFSNNLELVAISNMLYFKAFSLLSMGYKEEAISTAKDSLFMMKFENNQNRMNHFIKNFEREFEMSYEELMSYNPKVVEKKDNE